MLVKVQASTRQVSARKASAPVSLNQRIAAVAAGIVLLAPNPAIAFDLANGRQVFENNCAACHMGGGNSVRPEATLSKEDINKFLQTPAGNGLTIDAIVYQVINGKGGMPAWGDRLDDEEIEDVANYVYDQASNNKWSA